MVRVREQVERPQRLEFVTFSREQADVPGKRDGIARHIDELGRAELRETGDDLLARSRPGRVEDDGSRGDP